MATKGVNKVILVGNLTSRLTRPSIKILIIFMPYQNNLTLILRILLTTCSLVIMACQSGILKKQTPQHPTVSPAMIVAIPPLSHMTHVTDTKLTGRLI